MKLSGSATTFAPPRPASAISSHAFAVDAARSSHTDDACTAAARNGGNSSASDVTPDIYPTPARLSKTRPAARLHRGRDGGRLADVIVAVAGATGALGSQVCRELVEQGASVRALVREPGDGPARALAALGVELVAADITVPASLAPVLDGAETVVSTATCFPRTDEIERVDDLGNRALVEAAEVVGAAGFVFVSFKPVPLDFSLQDAKRSVERRLERSPLRHVILRPGKIMDVWFSPLCGFDVAARRATVFGSGEGRVSWIASRDLARIAAAAALAAAEPRPSSVVELGGPEALSQREVLALFEVATGSRWQTDVLSVERIEESYRTGDTAVARSLAALMLEAHHGAVTDPGSFARMFPLQLTTVAEFAAAAARKTSEISR